MKFEVIKDLWDKHIRQQAIERKAGRHRLPDKLKNIWLVVIPFFPLLSTSHKIVNKFVVISFVYKKNSFVICFDFFFLCDFSL